MADTAPSVSFVDRLNTKIGPFPAWAYAIPIVGGAYAYYYWKKKNAAAPATTTQDSYGDPNAADSGVGSPYGINDGTGMVSVGAGGSTGGQSTVPDNTAPASNQSWMTLATSYLVGQGFPATEVAQALNDWILGIQATAQDNALFNLAVARFGAPPEGVPPQPTQTSVPNPGLPGGATHPTGTPVPPVKPVTTPKPRPPKPKLYKVVSGDNLTRIAGKFHISEASLYSMNKQTIEDAAQRYGHDTSNNGNLIFPGTVLTIG